VDAAHLKSISLFSSLSDQDLESIAAFAEEVSVPEGKVLVKEGDWAYELIGIEEGTARVERDGDHIAELKTGDFFGEVGVLESQLRTATVVASSPMRLIVLTRWEIKRLEKQAPEAIEQLMRAVEERRPQLESQAG
jgi:CRP/FNR family cyclic AMP-dependent transcriptional regulator